MDELTYEFKKDESNHHHELLDHYRRLGSYAIVPTHQAIFELEKAAELDAGRAVLFERCAKELKESLLIIQKDLEEML